MFSRGFTFTLSAFCAALAFGAPAVASPVDFTGTATSSGSTSADLTLRAETGHFHPYVAGSSTGMWSEAGFNIEFGGDLVRNVDSPFINNMSQTYMSDSGCCDDSYTHLEISRADGATFSFDGMELTRSYSDTWVQAGFRAFDASGALAQSVTVEERTRLNFDNIRMVGTRADGSDVEVIASGFTDTAENPNVEVIPGTVFNRSGTSRILQLDPNDQSSLSNLTSLRIEAGTYESVFDIYASSFRFVSESSTADPFRAGDLSDNMMLGYVECLMIRQQETCVVDGVGEFSFATTRQLRHNFNSSTAIGGLQFTVDPAPVPLPAGGWLLLAAGGMLLGLRRRARALARA